MSDFSKPRMPGGKKGGGGLVFLLIIGFAMFMLMNKSGPANPSDDGFGSNPGGGQADSRGDVTLDDLKPRVEEGGRMPRGTGNAKNGDWGASEVSAQQNPSKRTPLIPDVKPTTSKVRNGDWGAEEVDPSKKDNRFQFSNQKPKVPREKGKATKGDWGSEEVDPSKGSTPAAPKKVRKGDWGSEEVPNKSGVSGGGR